MNTHHALGELDLEPDPLRQFERWFAEVRTAGVEAPETMALATAAPGGAPSVRMVLLKGVDERGFAFHTSYESRKAAELGANPLAALLFYWHPPGRQVRVEGRIERLPAAASEEYFRTRPRESRIAAWASRQSSPLRGRAELDQAYAEVSERFAGEEVPLPPHWGGYLLVPEAYEFWQRGEHRLHDRFRYERGGSDWTRVRLAP